MRLPERSGDQLRIGVAVTVPEPWGSELRAARSRYGDPLAEFIPPHITLLGPTVVDPEQMVEVEEHLTKAAARHTPFVVRLRGTGTFRPVSPVVFVELVDGAPGCAALERSVRTGVLDQDLRFDYHPHVTVAHEVPDDRLDAAAAGLADFEAAFVVTEFHSYLHGDDGVWRPVQDFALDLGSAPVGLLTSDDASDADAGAVRPT
ncbi:2'-5' RNA ligase family protein [Cellulomonas fimi]|uniref:2'-5' RNA ligase family protein n=1 Tax=Cellulomonas fimi TaxID=1708 RepID=UPI00234D405B|nr:2'-5' RNA ligase family protein [Cellulomonas fimi]MDC7119953.1 2'-5' RNA ligase family protein [Cellulomonas fimi]